MRRGWSWSGGCSASASAPSAISTSTSRACPPARSSTRGCSPRSSWSSFFPDLSDARVTSSLAPGALPVLHQHLPVLAAGAPVPLRRAQRRDQHPARQPELDARAGERCSPPTSSPATSSGCSRSCTPERQRLRDLRRGARAAAPGRPLHAARGADDDPGGVGEPHRDGPGAPGVLRVPLHADGAVGRPRADRVHRRHRDRRRARPQRPASRPATGSPRTAWWCMASEVGVLDIDPDHGGAQGPPAAGPDVPGRHRRRAGSSTTTRSRPSSPPSTRTPMARRRPDPAGELPARERDGAITHASLVRRQQLVRLHRGGARVLLAPMAATARSRSGRWAPTPRWRRPPEQPAAAVRLLHPAVRPGHQPAAGRDPRGAGHLARRTLGARAQPARTRRRLLPADRAALPGHRTTTSSPRSSTSTTTATSRSSRRPTVRDSTRCTEAAPALVSRLDEICAEVVEPRSSDGARLIVLSDRGSDAEHAPIPSLLLTGGGAPPPDPGARPAPGSA